MELYYFPVDCKDCGHHWENSRMASDSNEMAAIPGPCPHCGSLRATENPGRPALPPLA